jgi:arylsulfatase
MEIRRWNAQPSDYFLSKGIKEKGGIRNQYSYVNDIAPTTLELIKGEFPQTINGVVQKPFEGKSLVYSFENAQAKTTHTIQHNEIKGKRSIYKDGWKAPFIMNLVQILARTFGNCITKTKTSTNA